MEKVTYLTRDQILAAKDLEPFDEPVPEWGGWIKLRPINGGERRRARNLAKVLDEVTGGSMQDDVKMACAGLCIAMVEPPFTLGDIVALEAKASGVVDRVWTSILVKSGFLPGDQETIRRDLANRMRARKDSLSPTLNPDAGVPDSGDFTPPPNGGS